MNRKLLCIAIVLMVSVSAFASIARVNATAHPECDLNKDGSVGLDDIMIVVVAFGSYPGQPRWNATADVNVDGRVDMTDIWLVLLAFGK
jgi:hypothetical protein